MSTLGGEREKEEGKKRRSPRVFFYSRRKEIARSCVGFSEPLFTLKMRLALLAYSLRFTISITQTQTKILNRFRSRLLPPAKSRESQRVTAGRCCTRREKLPLISLALGEFIARSLKAPGSSASGGCRRVKAGSENSRVSLLAEPPACSGTFAPERHHPRE